MAILRPCGKELGLSSQVLRTLEVLLSCLAPKRNHHVVFASNATLVSRSAGLSERSIRRHIAELVHMGLAERADSANGKRYCRHDPEASLTLRFGVDLHPLFAKLPQLRALSEAATIRVQKLRYLRCKLRAACQRILRQDPAHALALAHQNAARRNLSLPELEALLASLPVEISQESIMEKIGIESEDLASSGGQNDRHQSNLSKEHIEINKDQDLQLLLQHCHEAQSFALQPIVSQAEMIEHAEKLAPMIGVTPQLWQKATLRKPACDLAALIWMMLENLPKISKPAAYFQSITIGKKAHSFAPWAWLQRQAS